MSGQRDYRVGRETEHYAFWKLHGWIDDRIAQWERASERTADFSQSWEGPTMHDHGPMEHVAAVRGLTAAEADHAPRLSVGPRPDARPAEVVALPKPLAV